MIDLIKVMSSERFFEVTEYLKLNPNVNASSISSNLNIHIITVQRYLEVLEKYGFVSSREKRGIGRPSKTYTFLGGKFTLDIDELLKEYSLRSQKIREKENSTISYNYDIDNERIKQVIIGGRKGTKVELEDKSGKFLWMLPPPDSEGESIEKLASQSGMAVLDAVKFVRDMIEIGVMEVCSDE